MSVVLFKPADTGYTKQLFEPEEVHAQLKHGGWFLDPGDFEKIETEEELDDAPLLEDLPNHEVRALAKEAGIENHDDARIATLIKKLREQNGTTEG